MITSLTGVGDTQQPVMPAMLGYRMVEASFEKQQAAFRNSAPVKREIDYFKTAIAKVTSADDLVKDYRLFRFVLSAYGLDSQIDAKAFMKKVLTSDLSDAKSFVNKLTDPRFAAPERFLGVMGMPINAAGEIESENLTLACRNAVLNMIELLQERGYSREQAYVICSVAVDLRISNVVDVPNYVVSALLPEVIFDDA